MSMKVITVVYLSATNCKKSRMKARTNTTTITIPYPHEIRESNVYAYTAMLLAKKMQWDFLYAEGSLPNGEHVFVPVTDSTQCTINASF